MLAPSIRHARASQRDKASAQGLVEEQRPSGGGFSVGGGNGEPSREFANAASSLLDEGLDDEVRAPAYDTCIQSGALG